MSRWIDADELGASVIKNTVFDKGDVIKLIEDAPSIDIVHCRECKHENSCEHQVLLSTMWGEVEDTADIEYCSYGERKSDE